MADKYYAWSRFPLGQDEWGRTTGWIQPGDEVDAAKLDCSDDAFAQLVEVGAVRNMPYPVPEGFTTSPVEHLRSQALRLSQGLYTDEDAQNALAEFTGARDFTTASAMRAVEAEESGTAEEKAAAQKSTATANK